MTKDEYKKAYRQSNIVLDRWLHLLNITIDQHKSYSSGRTAIPTDTCLLIEKISNKRRKALEALQDELRKIEHIEHYKMDIDEQSDNLVLTPVSEKGIPIVFKNEGLDPFLFEVYSLVVRNANLTLIFYPENGLTQPKSPRKWFVIKVNDDRLSHIINDSTKELHNMITISLDS